MSDTAWQESILERVRLLPESSASYDPHAPSLAHYRAVSEILLGRFHDLTLSRAGFLHGVHVSELPALRGLPGVTEEIVTILDERNRLRSLGGTTLSRRDFSDAEGDEVSRHLASNVLPLIRHGHSVVLMVLEQTNHLDRDGQISQWSINFRFEPRPLPAGSANFVADHFPNMAARIHFLRFVVAATADFFGMWPERNVALDLALLHENRDRFEEIVDRVLEDADSEESASKERVAYVRQRLAGTTVIDVRWEWYSIASMHRHLRKEPTKAEWDRSFDQLGCVTVVCEDEASCYTALARLHVSGNFADAAIRDYIGSPRTSGYRAIHTALIRRTLRSALSDLVPVHVMTSADWERHIVPSGPEQLERIEARIRRDEHRVLTVFAPDGRAVELPLGSVVLNFALKLHTHLVARVRGATVNRRSVGLLHRLGEGDVVWLDVGDIPQLLPSDWEAHVPPQTIASIRREIPRAYRRMLVANGERWFREQLAAHGLEDTSPAELVDAATAAANDVLTTSGTDAPWLYRQAGAHDAIDRGVTILTPSIARAQLMAIAGKTVNNVRDSPSITADYEIPVEFAGRYDRTITCPICEPQSDEVRSATLDHGLLTIHRANEPCAVGGLLLRRRRGQAVRRHYFTVEVSNITNNLVEILSIFREMQTDVAHLAARRLNAGWRVVRIGCDYVMPDRQQRILRALKNLPGVMRVTGPEDPPIGAIEDVLPPRSLDSLTMRRSEPYQVGPPVDDDRLFYGMDAELARLEQIFARVTHPDAGSGEFVFVSGPLRIGKTSLAKQFLRRINRDLEHKHLSIYHMPLMERWSQVASGIRETLISRLPQSPLSVRSRTTLEETIREVRRAVDLPLTIVIDEVVGLLQLNSQWPDELEAFQRFCRSIRATPGVLIVWIGPAAAVRSLGRDIIDVITRSESVTPARFNDAEVDALLKADKMGRLYGIEANRGLARAVRRLTDGNPYWVAHLGKTMYDIQATRHGQQRVTYSHSVLELAKERLFLQPIAFAHQLPDLKKPEGRKKFAVLQTLADGGGENRFVALPALEKALQGVLGASDIREMVEDLYLEGALKIENEKVKVATPLLAEYVRFVAREENRQ